MGRHCTIEERHKNAIEGWHYSMGRHCIIEERHKNAAEGWRYSMGRHYPIEERHKNAIEGWHHSIGRYRSIGLGSGSPPLQGGVRGGFNFGRSPTPP